MLLCSMYGSKFLLPIFVCLLLTGHSRAQNWEWVKTSTGSSYESINAVAVDQTDRTTYVVGEIAGSGSYPSIGINYGNEDAFVIKYDVNGNVLWGFPIGGSSKDEATGIEVDQSTGNIYVTGYIRRAGVINFTGAITGASGTISAGGGNNDAFIACYTKTGSLLWFRLIGGNNDDRGLDVTVNSSGVYVIGYYTGSASYGAVSTVLSNGSINYFVAAYNPANGNFLWGNEMGSSVDDFVFSATGTSHERRGCGITSDANGVYVVNLFGGINYGIYHEGGSIPIALVDLTLSPEDIVVSSFTNAGIYNWATLYNNNSGFCSGVDITNDCNGVYITGSMSNNSVSPGGTTIVSATDNAFIARIAKASGNEVWIRQLNSSVSNGDYFMGIQADGYGCVYAVGMMGGTSVQMEVSPAVHTETGASTTETIIVKYGVDGVFKSFERLPSTQGNGGWATDIATLGNTSILVAGYYDESLTLGGINAPSNDDNGFVARKVLVSPFYYTSASGNNSFCISEPNPLPTVNVVGSGTFSGPPQIVFANTSTGLINLSACTPGGPYTITYSIPVASCKAFSGTFDIYILPTGNASFNFATSNFCTGGPNPTPTVTTPGGTFSSTPGLVFTNVATGQLDLTNSAVGNYTITYTTSGTCPGTSTFNVTIQAPSDPTFSYPSNIYCSANPNPTPTVATAGGTFTSTAGLVFVSASSGQINLSASTPGTYTVTYTTGGLCPNSSTFTLTIVSTDDPTFSYAANSFCQGGTNPSPSSITTAGGTFSAPAGIVFVSSATGEINLAASTPGGPYAITYTTNGVCPASSNFAITILAEEDATFSYASSNYCPTDANPTPTTALSGGTFASTAGLVFVNTTTGEIDLANSTPGSYTITYTTAGPNCPNSSTASITITASDDPTFSYAANSFCQGGTNPSPSSITTAGGTFSAPAGIVFVSTATGEINLAASTPGGPYAITYTTNGVCQASSNFAITIFAEEDATFSYASSNYCPTDANPTPTTALSGGTFASTAGLVFVNTTTGEIDLANSTPGSYTITYTTAGPNCPNSSTASITITASDDPTFSYAANSFCQGGTNPSPSSITTAGGTFSAPAGIVFVSTATGEINLAASTPGGPYAITYTTNGVCQASSNFAITIFAEEDATFSYASSNYCPTDANPTPTTALSGGTFASTAGLVFVNTTTGEIDLANSTPGSYTITYTTAGPNCPNSSTALVTINALDIVSLSYPASKFCESDEDQLPNFSPPGGTFTSSIGLELLSASTGVFSPSLSTKEQAHTITYTSNGACPDYQEFTVTIASLPSADAGEDQILPFLFSTEMDAAVPMFGTSTWSTDNYEIIVEAPSDAKSSVKNLPTGKTEFTWSVSNGTCPVATDKVLITVEDLWIPQAVTPNNDGDNDFFALKSIDDVRCDLQLFNRWGQVIYSSENYKNEWQGQNMQGTIQPNDTYFYVILIDGKYSYNGYVILKK